LQGKKCGICKKVCQADAINFEQEDRIITLSVGAIIIAVGYDVFDPSQIPEYRFRELPNVVTAMEFERLLSASGPTHGHLDRPSDRAVVAEIKALEKRAKRSQKTLDRFEKKHDQASADVYEKYRQGQYQDDEDRKKWADKYAEHLAVMEPLETMQKKAESFTVAKRLAFIQCVGSRDFRFYPFCSGYCCMHSIKEAVIAHEHETETTSAIFGMDIRAVSKGFEEYKIRGGNNSNITYVRGRVSEIIGGADHNPVVIYEDTQQRQVKEEEFDMAILATACAPTKGMVELAKTFGVELDEYNFIKTSSLAPVDTSVPGIFVCGCAESPMDVPESVAQASSAAERAAETVIQSTLEKEKAVA
jgi:heterodisulfide reductase subunit A-like polyferredoxin